MGLGEATVLAPRAVEAKAGHAHHDDVGPAGSRGGLLVGQPGVVHDTRGEVLDDDIGVGGEPKQLASRPADRPG